MSILFLFLLTSGLAQLAPPVPLPPIIKLQDSRVYTSIYQDQRTWNFYSFDVGNLTLAQLSQRYFTIRLDVENEFSDPDIFISTKNQRPRSEADSEHQCTDKNQQICIPRRSLYSPNDVIYFSVRCIQNCTYSLRVGFASMQNMTDGTKINQRLEWRSVSIYSFFIPEMSNDGPTQSIYFITKSIAPDVGRMRIKFSPSNDLQFIEDNNQEIISDYGYVLKFTSDDIGWCTRCFVFFVVSVNAPNDYSIFGKTTSRKEILQNQMTILRSFNQQQRECFSYNFLRSVNDGILTVRLLQGTIDFTVIQKNSLGQDLQLLSSEYYYQSALIIRNQDRLRFNSSNPNSIQLCFLPWIDSSVQISTSQQYWLGRYEIVDDTLYTFNLDSKDYVTFRFNSRSLIRSQQISIELQAFNNTQSIPRIYYSICQSSFPEECSFSDSQAFGNLTTQLNTSIDLIRLIRSGIINHNPADCPNPSSCIYLISVANSDITGPQKYTFKLNTQIELIPINLFQQYQESVPFDSYHYFQIKLTPNQQRSLLVNQILIDLTSYIGQAELYVSTVTKYPNENNFQWRAKRAWPFNSVALTNNVDFNIISDTIYVGVYGKIQTQYLLKIGANYQVNQPVYSTAESFANSGQNITVIETKLPNGNQSIMFVNTSFNPGPIQSNGTNLTVYPIPIEDGQTYNYQVASNMTDIIIYYRPTQNQINQRTIHFIPTLLNNTQNYSLRFNVTYGAFEWNNNTQGLTLYPGNWSYDPSNIFIIRFRGCFRRPAINSTNATTNSSQQSFNKSKRHHGGKLYQNVNSTQNRTNNTNSSSTNTTNQNQNSTPQVRPIIQEVPALTLNFKLGVYSVIQSSDYIQFTKFNQTYTGYANDTVITFTTLLMDLNATYNFRLFNKVGLPAFMFKSGPLFYQEYDIEDDTTYDYASKSFELEENQWLRITRQMRESVNPRCRNGTYPLRGGNDNCTMTIAIQCSGICIFNFEVSVNLPNNLRYMIDQPQLFTEGQIFDQQQGFNGQIQYFFTPFMRNRLGDVTLVLNKLTNDSYLIGRVITNAFTPFTTWNYPNPTSFDFISRNPDQNFELIEISGALFTQRCPTNSSCALIIGVVSNAGQTKINGTTFEQNGAVYSVSMLQQSRKLQNATLINAQISFAFDFDYYWLIINNTSSWRFLVTTASVQSDKDVDLYITIGNGLYPTEDLYDFKADRLGSDAITLSQDSIDNQNFPKILLMIGVRSKMVNTSYQLFIYGPNTFDSSIYQYTDLQRSVPFSFVLPQRSVKPQNNYRVFRYFNYGTNDLLVNITSTDNSIYVLASNNPYKQVNYNSFFNIPIITQLSKVSPINILKGQTFQLRINRNINNQLFCTFCWINIVIFQNSTSSNQLSGVTITTFEMNTVDSVPIMNTSTVQSFLLILNGSFIQRKFMFDFKEPVTLQISSNNTAFTAFVNRDIDLGLSSRIWSENSSTSTNSTVFFRFRQTDRNFQIGQFYYLTIISNSSLCNVSLNFQQKRTVTLLESNVVLKDSMINSEDFIKFYYFIPPKDLQNFTMTININSITQGFYPSIYVLKNDIINGSFNYMNLQYPSIIRYSAANEYQYNQPFNPPFSLAINSTGVNRPIIIQSQSEQNVTINQTTIVNVTQNVTNPITKKNQTVTVQRNITTNVTVLRNVTVNTTVPARNQTYYTVAVYLNNFGFTDIQKAEFEISYNVTNFQGRLQQENNFKCQDLRQINSPSSIEPLYVVKKSIIKQYLQEDSNEDSVVMYSPEIEAKI